MAIASGTHVPAVYILDDEPAINSFAAGLTSSDAVVTVTRGTLEKLSRDELQGVIAHEFSHILNGDMRMNVRVSAIIFGILVIGLAGRATLWGLRGSSRGRNQQGPTGTRRGSTTYCSDEAHWIGDIAKHVGNPRDGGQGRGLTVSSPDEKRITCGRLMTRPRASRFASRPRFLRSSWARTRLVRLRSGSRRAGEG